jgi:hypothetical protein
MYMELLGIICVDFDITTQLLMRCPVLTDRGEKNESTLGLTARVRFQSVQDSSLLHSVQTDSGAYPASYPVGTGGSSSGGKA